MPKKLVVFGGAGFLGSHIVEAFLRRDWSVGVLDGLVAGTGGARKHLHAHESDLQFLDFQRIEDAPALAERVQWADWIVDAMGFTGHLVGFENPSLDTRSNLLSHLQLIQALKSAPGKRLIYLGTRSQYGAVSAEVITEDTTCCPLDPQGINKLAAEQFFRIYSKPYGFDVISLRLTNCFGPNQRLAGELGLVGGFIQDVLGEKPIEIFGNAERRKSLLFGADVAQVVFELTQRSWRGFEVFNVGGNEVSIRELLEMIFRAAGQGRFSVKPFPDHVKRIDVGEAIFSDEKLARFLGSRERTPLESAVEMTVDYFKQNQKRIQNDLEMRSFPAAR